MEWWEWRRKDEKGGEEGRMRRGEKERKDEKE